MEKIVIPTRINQQVSDSIVVGFNIWTGCILLAHPSLIECPPHCLQHDVTKIPTGYAFPSTDDLESIEVQTYRYILMRNQLIEDKKSYYFSVTRSNLLSVNLYRQIQVKCSDQMRSISKTVYTSVGYNSGYLLPIKYLNGNKLGND